METTFSELKRLRDKILRQVRKHVGEDAAGTTYMLIAREMVKKIFPNSDAGYIRMLLDCQGDIVTSDDAYRMADILTGWHRLLEKKVRPFRWTGTPAAWHMLEVYDVYREVHEKFGTTGKLVLVLKPLAGPATGSLLREVFPAGALWNIIREVAGKMYDYTVFPEDVYGMRFTAACRREGSMFMMDEVFADSSQQALNRKRVRTRQGKCLHPEVTDLATCGICWLGEDQCPKARHRNEWRYGLCLKGGHSAPLGPQGYCAECMFNNRKNRNG